MMVDIKDFSKELTGLLNMFPALEDGQEIRFAELSEEFGISIYPSASATVISEKSDICGGVYQKCSYAFQVIYRSAPQTEDARLHIKSWLDRLARWLEKQPINVDGKIYTITNYPDIGSERKITEFVQTAAAYLARRYDDGVEDWAVSLSMRYDNHFER